MRKILLVCAALACMTVSPVPAQDAAVKKIIEMGQNDNQVMHQLDILTNRFGGRLIVPTLMRTPPSGWCVSLRVGDSMSN